VISKIEITGRTNCALPIDDNVSITGLSEQQVLLLIENRDISSGDITLGVVDA
jgi:hypothetical protein